jgi:hypothetical protein
MNKIARVMGSAQRPNKRQDSYEGLQTAFHTFHGAVSGSRNTIKHRGHRLLL